MTTRRFIHQTCGQEVEADEYGITTEGHELNQCRGSAIHQNIDLPEDLRSTKAQLYGKKGTF